MVLVMDSVLDDTTNALFVCLEAWAFIIWSCVKINLDGQAEICSICSIQIQYPRYFHLQARWRPLTTPCIYSIAWTFWLVPVRSIFRRGYMAVRKLMNLGYSAEKSSFRATNIKTPSFLSDEIGCIKAKLGVNFKALCCLGMELLPQSAENKGTICTCPTSSHAYQIHACGVCHLYWVLRTVWQ